MKRAYHAAMGCFQILFGTFLVGYVLLWVCGLIRWSADITFIIMAAFGAVCIASGVLRLTKNRPLFCFRRKWLNCTAKTLLALTCAGIIGIQGLICSACFDRAQEETPYAVIFGARIYGSVPSLMLSNRIAAGAEYLNAHPSSGVIACGGFTQGETVSEAQVIRTYLGHYGVDASRVILDEDSYDSRQSVVNADRIISRAGGDKRVTVVTSDYHMFRCKSQFRALGYQVQGYASDTAPYLRPVAHFREMLSILRDFACNILGIC